MKEKILFAIYAIRIKSRKEKDYIVLNDKEKDLDFLQKFKEYFQEILITPQVLETIKNEEEVEIPTKKLTLVDAQRHKVNSVERYIIGTFHLGTADNSVDIIDFNSNEPLIKDSDKTKYGHYRKFFFYLEIPLSKKIGYIVIQKSGKHGMKGDFRQSFDKWFKHQGLHEEDYSFHLTQISNTKLIEKLIKEKTLKQFKIIRHKVPVSTEESFKKGTEITNSEQKGTFEIAYKSTIGLDESYKDTLIKFFSGIAPSKTIELGIGIEQTFDEIQYSLDINGKAKSFYLYKEIKMRSDRDVTDDVDYKDYKPTEESLIRVSKEMVIDFSIPE